MGRGPVTFTGPLRRLAHRVSRQGLMRTLEWCGYSVAWRYREWRLGIRTAPWVPRETLGYAPDQCGYEPIDYACLEDALTAVTKDNTPFTQAGGEEYLAFHLITETMLQKGGREWRLWYPTVRDKMLKVQNADGSWTGLHCITSRTFCTAAASLVLTAPNRYLPISQQ